MTGREKVGNTPDDERECCFALLTLWREQVHREMMMRILAQDREKQMTSLRKAEMYLIHFRDIDDFSGLRIKKQFKI
jgi:hypothetical protein